MRKTIYKAILKPSQQTVLNKLKEKAAGITSKDFATGFALAPRVFELREKGAKILTVFEHNARTGGNHARYVLRSLPASLS